MFLQSYILRASKATLALLEDPGSFLMECDDDEHAAIARLSAGLQDLVVCTRFYRGATRCGSQITTIAHLRLWMERLCAECVLLQNALSKVEPVPSNPTAFDSPPEFVRALREWNTTTLRECVKRMETVGWDEWRSAKAAYSRGIHPGYYPDPASCPEVNLPVAPAKRVAKYFPMEGSALTAGMMRSTSNIGAWYSTISDVSWHLGSDKVAAVCASDKTGYMDIFESDMEEDYIYAVYSYWESLMPVSVSRVIAQGARY